ncbi:MAG: hypothetical protein GY754_22370 [bacterium]|nr:hypothetical protein [bacterium]
MKKINKTKRWPILAAGLLFITVFQAGCETPAPETDPPEAVVITGVVNSTIYNTAVTPEWGTAEGTVNKAVLTKNSAVVSAYQEKDELTEDGMYALTVTTTKTENDKTATAVVHFMIDQVLPVETLETNISESGTALEIYFHKGVEMDIGGKPLYVIWIEDMEGTFIQNLYVGNTPATNVMRFTNTWVARPQALPYWTHKSCGEDPYKDDPAHNTAGLYLALPSADGGPVPADLDAVTGATPYVDFLLKTKRKSGQTNRVRIVMEINRSFDDNAYYDAAFSGDTYYDGSQPSLVYGAEIDINSTEKLYLMELLGAGHHSGGDGELHDAGFHTTALDIVDTVVISVK